MKSSQPFAAGETVAQTFDRSADAEIAATRLRAAGFSDIRLSESAGRSSAEHVAPADGATEVDFAALLEGAGFTVATAREVTRAVAAGAVLLTVAAGDRARDAEAVLRGEKVVARPLGPVDPPLTAESSGAGPLPTHLRAVPQTREVDAVRSPAPSSESVDPSDKVVALHAERLDVRKERTTGEARVRKEIVTEQKTITVPVQREQLVVERDGQPPVRIPLSEPES